MSRVRASCGKDADENERRSNIEQRRYERKRVIPPSVIGRLFFGVNGGLRGSSKCRGFVRVAEKTQMRMKGEVISSNDATSVSE